MQIIGKDNLFDKFYYSSKCEMVNDSSYDLSEIILKDIFSNIFKTKTFSKLILPNLILNFEFYIEKITNVF